jgi:uncharacterized membrane protein
MGRYASPPTGETFPHWWWWQASRIVQDFDFNWVNKGDIINEFPFFSFLLADLHPHVLAMPFAFLAITLALNLFLGGGEGQMRWLWMKFGISPVYFLLVSLVLGSLSFFNTWDFPFYVAIFSGAYLLRGMLLGEKGIGFDHTLWSTLGKFIILGFALGVSGVLLFLPFYFGFQSQAGGPLPNLIYITKGIYLWIHFIPFLVPVLGFLLYQRKESVDSSRLRSGIKITIILVIILMALTLLLTFLISIIQIFQKINPDAVNAANAFLGSLAAPDWGPLIVEGLKRRLTGPGTWLTMVVVISLAFALLFPRKEQETVNRTSPKEILQKDYTKWSLKRDRDDTGIITDPMTNMPSNIFANLLILIGALLVLVPEFVFLRDLFGYRINTIFKFYFQVWLMWGIAASYGTILLWRYLKGVPKVVFRITMIFLIASSMTYPVMGLWSKTNGFKPYDGFTLDGTAYLERSNPDEASAMEWLKSAPLGVVAEAIGGSYSSFARMASHTGQPTVLGWDFHEVQWRGGTEEMGSRRTDIERLYCTNDWNEAENILRQYHVRYIVVGTLERSSYGVGSVVCSVGLNESKFSRHLPQVFNSGDTSIYQIPDEYFAP